MELGKVFDRRILDHIGCAETLRTPRALWLAGLVFASLSLGGCNGILDPQGPVGMSQKLILLDSTVIMLAIVVPVILASFAFAYWFRAGNARAFYWPNWEFSGALEIIIWSIPLLTVTFLGGIAWFGSQNLDPFRPLNNSIKPVEVEAVSLDWKWLFIYPDEGVASVNELALPVGAPVHFRLTSSGVMNAFFVPQLGSMIYTMAGMVTQLHLQADHPGTYLGISANFSGQGFADMHFDARALSSDAYAQWVQAAKSGGATLDRNRYAELVRPSVNLRPETFGAVDKGLFDAIATGAAGAAPNSDYQAPGGMQKPMATGGGG